MMSRAAVTLQLPEDIYERVRRAAKGMKQPMATALVNIVRAATPSLEKVPPPYRAELEEMEDFTDEALRKVAESALAPAQERRLNRLLDKNQRGQLTKRGRQTLMRLRSAIDGLMLQRSYAYLLLKYRGHQIPNLADLKQ
jgi:hypothetical protein